MFINVHVLDFQFRAECDIVLPFFHGATSFFKVWKRNAYRFGTISSLFTQGHSETRLARDDRGIKRGGKELKFTKCLLCIRLYTFLIIFNSYKNKRYLGASDCYSNSPLGILSLQKLTWYEEGGMARARPGSKSGCSCLESLGFSTYSSFISFSGRMVVLEVEGDRNDSSRTSGTAQGHEIFLISYQGRYTVNQISWLTRNIHTPCSDPRRDCGDCRDCTHIWQRFTEHHVYAWFKGIMATTVSITNGGPETWSGLQWQDPWWCFQLFHSITFKQCEERASGGN